MFCIEAVSSALCSLAQVTFYVLVTAATSCRDFLLVVIANILVIPFVFLCVLPFPCSDAFLLNGLCQHILSSFSRRDTLIVNL